MADKFLEDAKKLRRSLTYDKQRSWQRRIEPLGIARAKANVAKTKASHQEEIKSRRWIDGDGQERFGRGGLVISRIRLNKDGYTRGGTYYGEPGWKLWRVDDETTGRHKDVRADNMTEAIVLALKNGESWKR